MADLESGLYETIVTQSLQDDLVQILEDRATIGLLQSDDVAKRIGQYVGSLVERALSGISDRKSVV